MEQISPLITVVIPVFNAAQTIGNTVKSIVEQPNSDSIEILLVDDGSTDAGAHICDEFAKAHSNVRTFHKENGGVSSARNLGIDYASGKYLAFLDSDDWWEPNFLTDALAEELKREGSSDLYCFSYQKVSPSKKWVKTQRIANSVNKYDTPGFSHQIGQHHSAFLIKTSYLIETGFRYLPTKVREDVAFTQICCTYAKSITCIDKVIFTYWMNNSSCMHTKKSTEKFFEHYKAEQIIQSIHQAHGLDYDLDRAIISLSGEYLSYISAENPYRFVKQLLIREEFHLLNHSDIQPWPYLQKDIALWRKRPFFAYLKNRSARAPLLFFKRVLLSIPLTQPLAEYFQYRVIEKWSVNSH